MRRGDGGRPGPQGPQPTPLHPAGAAGRPPREERAQGQSLHAAGGAGLLQKVHARVCVCVFSDLRCDLAMILGLDRSDCLRLQ